MLSTPPAFILSQDQTLKLKFVSQFLTDFLFPKITSLFSSSFELTLGFGLFSTVQFSRFNVFFRFNLSPSALFILPDFSFFVKNFFLFIFFQVLNLNLKFSDLFVAFILPTTMIYYTRFLKNVNTFFKFFSFLFLAFKSLVFAFVFQRQRIFIILTFLILSTPFFNFFQKVF